MRRIALILALLPGPVLAEGLAVLPIKLLDTSHEVRDQSGDHARRLGLMAEALARDMGGAPVLPEAVAQACPRETQDCLIGLLRQQGADRGLFVVVQKSSTLILQVFASVVDVRAEKLLTHRELNFRGDNDEAWRRAGRFMARQLR
ncbi:DUF2380 domain-containing protein [Paracoccus laeviglucosivorans]|nr:DUF2380 domain-containing protein [Paracoccus laeviglucosivorans]